VLTLDRADLAEPVPAPTDAQVSAFHAANPDLFTLPEARRITYVWLTPEMLMDEVEIDEDALREAYRLRAAEFDQPQRRIVERLVFPDEAAAAAGRARIDAGEVDFTGLVEERGLSLADTDMGDVTEAELGAAGGVVFALTEPGLAGPAPSPFGPALYNVVAILAAQQVPFEDAVPELREALALDRARRVISDRFDEFEDLLAGGATLEELAAESALEIGQIDLRPDSSEGIAAYEAFRTAAAAVQARDFPEMRALEGGGIFALRLDEIVPPAVQPLEEVIVRAIEGWDRAEARDRVRTRAEEVLAALTAGETPDALGLIPERFEEVARGDRLPGLPASVPQAAFALGAGARQIVPGPETAVHIVTVEAVLPVEPGDAEAEATRQAIENELRASVAQDVFTAWARQLEREAGIRLDTAAIEAVHAQFR
jgi:peptidyl-prolyl cis-trans isomerase D